MRLTRCFLSVVCLIASGSMCLAGSGSEDPWRLALRPVRDPAVAGADEGTSTASLVLQRATYEVEVVGAHAVGTVVQEFVHEGEDEVLAIYAGRAPGGTIPFELELEVDRAILEDAIAPSPAPRQKTQRRRSGAPPRETPADRQAQTTRPFAVPAGAPVTVTSSFRTELPFRDGRFQLRLPALELGIEPEGQEREAVTTPVPLGIFVTVFHDQPLPRIDSGTHNIVSGFEIDRTWVELAEQHAEARDFEMTFALGREDESTLSAFVGAERDGAREATVLFTPAIEPTEEAIRPKQLLLVLDTSGSMQEDKLKNAKLALASCLDKLGESDQLNLAEFDAGFTLFSPEPFPAQQRLAAAHGWLEGQQAGGGTHLMPALEAVLDQPASPEHHRMIVVLSDGNLSDEAAALELLQDKLRDARLFVIGIGKDVRQDTILRLSEYGRGTAVFVDRPEELENAVAGLFDSISQPLAWDLELDWGNAEVEVIGTDRIPDLYAARPVTVRARIRGELPSEVLLRVTTTEGTRTFVTTLPEIVRDRPGPPR